MKIPQGYKQTELGIIPEDWEITTFSQIFDIYPNNTYPRECMNDVQGQFRNIHYGDVLIKYPTVVDVKNSHIPFLNNEIKIKSHKTVRSGDVIIADTAEDETVGKCIEVKNANNSAIVAGLHTFFCRPRTSFASGWLGYFINSNQYHRQLLPYITGIKVASISRNSIQETLFVIPLIEEQKNIAEALSNVDALIAALDKKIAKKRLIKQGAMQQLLTGKKRLPNFSEKWVSKKLGEISRIKTGKRNGDEQVKNGKYPFFVRSNVIARIDSYSFDGEAILVPGEGGIGAIFHYVNGKFDYHQRVYKISDFADAIYGKYVYYYMQRYFGEYALSLSVKATVDSLRLPTFEEFSIALPNNIEEQQAIATILSDIDKEIADLEVCRDKYKLIKSGMMQKLLTGQIRLVKPLAPIIPLETPDAQIREIPLQTHVVAGHIVNALYQSSGWGRTKLQKTLHLVGYHCQLDFGNDYIRNTAGPDDQVMMNHIDSKFKQYRHVKIEAKKENGKTRYNYIPTTMIDELEQVYETYPQTIRHAVDSLINKIKKMDLARAEIVSTLYAVWNNRIIKEEPISDDLLLEDFYAWSKHKSDFSRDLVLQGLIYMRKEGIIPTGWGKYIGKK